MVERLYQSMCRECGLDGLTDGHIARIGAYIREGIAQAHTTDFWSWADMKLQETGGLGGRK